jgi:hypothetical protein
MDFLNIRRLAKHSSGVSDLPVVHFLNKDLILLA